MRFQMIKPKGKQMKSSRFQHLLPSQIVDKELTDDLIVSDAKVGGLIKEKLNIPVLCDSSTLEVPSCTTSVMTELTQKESFP